MRTHLLFLFLFSTCFSLTKAQSFPRKPDKNEYHIVYYHFVDGKQLVEIDFLSPWVAKENYREAKYPMGTTHRMQMGPHKANILIFRDTTGKVLKVYNNPSNDLKEYNILPIGHKKIKLSNHKLAFPFVLGWPYRYKPKYYRIYQIDSSCQKSEFSPAWAFDNSLYSRCKQGLVDSTGAVIIEPIYQLAFPVGKMIIIGQDQHFGLIEASSLVLIHKLKYESIMPSYYFHGYFDIKLNGKYGLLDPNGKWIERCRSKQRITEL